MLLLLLKAIVEGIGLVRALLYPIQTMQYYQHTAWGDSSTYMGGRPSSRPLQGLCQGNGVALACWQMLSALLKHHYHCQGFWLKFISPISGAVIKFFGQMYVDDMIL